MCNRIRGLKEWSEIPRSLTRSLQKSPDQRGFSCL
jgi:hypothetical protein